MTAVVACPFCERPVALLPDGRPTVHTPNGDPYGPACPDRLTNPRRPQVCQTPNCQQPTVRQVVSLADNTTGWFCDDCSSELPALYPFLRAVVR